MQATHAPRYQWTVEKYEKLGEAGIFGPNDRVELLNGEIIVMSPIGYRHAKAVNRLNNTLARRSQGRFIVSPQNPVYLDDRSEPEPDLVLLDPATDALTRHAMPHELHLIIEVADSTVRYDREEKRPAYARNKVREYWLLNLDKGHLELHRRPEGDQYRDVRVLGPAEEVSPEAFPDIVLRVGDYLP